MSDRKGSTAPGRIEARFSAAQDRLVIQASDLSLETIASMVDGDAIDLEPQFQRRKRWDRKEQSALIESFLLNVPVPPVYLAEDDYGNYSVIDGKQRITAIHEFMRDGYKLSSLEEFDEITGFTYSDLPSPLQNALRVRPYLRVVTLLKQSDTDLKYEVFTRLNKQGQPLNAQEIRNVAYRGHFNDMIVSLAEESDFLKKQMKIEGKSSKKYKKMDDVENVLRFFTMKEGWENFSGSYRESMDAFMTQVRDLKKHEVDQYRKVFKRSIDACRKIWGDKAFKRYDSESSSWRNQMLTGMYDAQMVACAEVGNSVVENAISRRSEIIDQTKHLFIQDAEFETAVREATNTPSRVSYRINKIVDVLRDK